MGKAKQGKKPAPATIAENRKARHDYFIEETLEAGVVLQGWEVKSLRDGRLHLRESYVTVDRGEAWLVGAHITPLQSASTHVTPDATRARKLLLHRREIDRIAGAADRQGYALIPLRMFWSRGRAKLAVGLARGKKQHDKRASARDRDWKREKERLLKHG